MTNLQQAANPQQQLWQQRLLLGVPALVGGLLAAAVVGAGAVPQWMRLQADSQELQRLQDLQRQLPLLRAQLDRTRLDQQQAELRQRRILELIQGSGEFATFLAQLDREAARHRVQLDLFEPVAAAPAAAEPARKAGAKPDDKAPPPPKPPLEAAGLQAESMLVRARGRYPELLSFMRAVEALSVLVVSSDFALVRIEPPAASGQPAAASTAPLLTELKVRFTYYKAPPDGLKPPPAKSPPAQPAAAKPPKAP
jgi:type IV pilus assembly protein PilO